MRKAARLRTVGRAAALAAVLAATAGSGIVLIPADAVTAKPAWSVTIDSSRTHLRIGQKIRILGTVSPRAAGVRVLLQERWKPGRPWVTQRKGTVTQDGSYQMADRPTANTLHSYRVVVPAARGHRRTVSPTVRVTGYAWEFLTSRAPENQHGIEAYPSVTIGDRTYSRSLIAYLLEDPASETSIEYDLDGKCREFRGLFGLSDDSEEGGVSSVSATADGTTWFSGDFGLGESTLDDTTWATPPQTIRFSMTPISYPDAEARGAVGTPEVSCTR